MSEDNFTSQIDTLVPYILQRSNPPLFHIDIDAINSLPPEQNIEVRYALGDLVSNGILQAVDFGNFCINDNHTNFHATGYFRKRIKEKFAADFNEYEVQTRVGLQSATLLSKESDLYPQYFPEGNAPENVVLLNFPAIPHAAVRLADLGYLHRMNMREPERIAPSAEVARFSTGVQYIALPRELDAPIFGEDRKQKVFQSLHDVAERALQKHTKAFAKKVAGGEIMLDENGQILGTPAQEDRSMIFELRCAGLLKGGHLAQDDDPAVGLVINTNSRFYSDYDKQLNASRQAQSIEAKQAHTKDLREDDLTAGYSLSD